MLDLIEYLARWVRGPGADRLPGPRRAPRPPPGLGRRAANATTISLEPLGRDQAHASSSPRCSPSGADDGRARSAPGRRALRRQPAVRRGDGQPDRRGGRPARPRRCRRPCTRCSRRGSTRSPRSERAAAPARRRSSARPSGRARSATPASRACDLRTTLESLRGQGPGRADRRQPPRRRARVRLQARADPRRRLLDPAEGGPRPQARRGRRVHRRRAPPTAPRA